MISSVAGKRRTETKIKAALSGHWHSFEDQVGTFVGGETSGLLFDYAQRI